jgi:1-acyl-sn-glycerol-3-phosphate acyltransferase
MKAFIFNFTFIFSSIILGLVASPLLLLPHNHRLLLRFARTWAGFSMFLLKYICNIQAEVVGSFPKKQPLLIASKHQSAWETIFFLLLFDNPVFVLKQELTKIPIYGWYLAKLGMVIIDRKAGFQAIQKLKKGAAEAFNNGRSLIIFPEGTRTKPGQKVRYKSGIKILAEEFNLPVIPIKLNSGYYWPKKKSGTIRVEILQPIISSNNLLRELEEKIDGN